MMFCISLSLNPRLQQTIKTPCDALMSYELLGTEIWLYYSPLSVGFRQRRPLNLIEEAPVHKLPCGAIHKPPCVQLVNSPLFCYTPSSCTVKRRERVCVCVSLSLCCIITANFRPPTPLNLQDSVALSWLRGGGGKCAEKAQHIPNLGKPLFPLELRSNLSEKSARP